MHSTNLFSNSPNSDTYIIDREYADKVVVNTKDVLPTNMIFNNVTFKKGAIFINFDSRFKLHFNECTFTEDLYLLGFTSYPFQKLQVAFNECTIKNILIKRCKAGSDLSFLFNDCKIGEFSCEDSHFDNIVINEGELTELRCTNNSIKSFSINDLQLEVIYINQLTVDSFILKDISNESYTNNSIELQEITANKVKLSKVKIGELLRIEPEKIQYLGLSYCSGEGTCIIDWNKKDAFIDKIEINYCGFKQGTTLLCGTPITECNYKHTDNISMYLDPLYAGGLKLKNLNIELIRLSGFNTSAAIQISDCRFGFILFKNFINNSELYLSNLSVFPENSGNSAFTITASKMGEAHFFNVNLASFDRFIYRDSDISEIGISHVTWFDGKKMAKAWTLDKKISKSEREELREELNRQRDLFRQLKVIMEKNGDKAYALEFFSWEMWYYRKIVKLRGYIADRFSLLIGQSNNFGTNWVKPLLILIALSFLCYIPMALIISNAETFDKAIEAVENNFHLWFHLMNPAHSLEKLIPDVQKTNWHLQAIDLLDRIIVSLFIYQIIIAFRKYFRN